ncbi:MAG TPA: alpha amylase C-terminal domain-containing protein, partial [Gaiellaceae bacterium]|nr:alpha amylase C-terminal domain-containing protein [Gaiellaceae bacterium]
LNRHYRSEPALYELDADPEGFRWLELSDADSNVIAFARFSRDGRALACLCNFAPVRRDGYRVALPRAGAWREVLNTDAVEYGGSGAGNPGPVVAEEAPRHHDHPFSAEVTLPPLGVVWLRPETP